MYANEVVITGYGLVAPGVMNANELFQDICNKKSCIRSHPEFVNLGFPNSAAGYIDSAQWQEIDEYLTGIDSQHKALPRQNLLTEYVARHALEHAGLSIAAFGNPANGVFIGANKYCVKASDLMGVSAHITKDGVLDFDAYLESSLKEKKSFALRVDQQTTYLARILGARNYISTHSDACAAGTIAIGSAFRAISAGKIDVAVCGAVELMGNELPYYMFHSLGALCEKQDLSPDQLSRPFMKDRGGFVLSEGAGLLVLESANHARKRGARPIGKVLGFYNHCEAEKITASQRDGNKYAACIHGALKDAGLAPQAVDHVNTHGTSTQVNDACEAKALLQVFGNYLEKITFTANKSALGHSLASSGALEAILSLISIERGTALPTLNYDEDEAEFPQLNFPADPLKQRIDVVLSNSFGFGGENSSLLLGGC